MGVRIHHLSCCIERNECVRQFLVLTMVLAPLLDGEPQESELHLLFVISAILGRLGRENP